MKHQPITKYGVHRWFLYWDELTPEERARLSGFVGEDGEPKEKCQFFRAGGELYTTTSYKTWTFEVPQKYEDLYPELFADQDTGSTDPVVRTESAPIAITAAEPNLEAVFAEYFRVKLEHTQNHTTADW